MKRGRRKLSEKVVVIHGQFVTYGRNAREWMRKCEMLLPHVERERVWEKKGFGSIYEYAAKLAGMNRKRVENVLWAMRKIEGKEEILKVVESKGVNAVIPIVNMVTFENQSFWAEKATEMSMHTLETYAKEYRKLENKDDKLNDNNYSDGLFESKSEAISPRAGRRVVGMELEVELLEELEKLRGKGDWNKLIKELLEMRRAKLESEKPETVKVVEKDEEGYHSRTAPAKIKKFVKAKTNGQCAFPACTKPHIPLHHTDRFALKREHNPDTLQPLCKEHEQLMHNGLIENEDLAPKYWKIREFADKSDVKWQIDKKVQQYRNTRRRI